MRMISTTVKRVCQASRMLCPPPNTILECVCQASLGLLDAGPFLATGGQQNSPRLGAMPFGTCVGTGNEKTRSWWFLVQTLQKRFVVCHEQTSFLPKFAQFTHRLHNICTVCTMFAQSVHKVCTKFAYFTNGNIVLNNLTVGWANCAHIVQTLCIFCANIVQTSGKLCAHCAHCAHLCKLCAHFLKTVCKLGADYV